jgi:eukaryotic-like serine/threonine-protein kinase
MALAAGARLGSYEIVGPLGAGGMGEVYRARDTTLNRDVALKILPDAFAHDPDRVARFKREAQVLAALSHPHIAAIHGLEQSGATLFLELEFVDGEDLARRLDRGPIPLDEAVPIARQIADALEAAHEQGIVHRDLKPANIKVRADGTVKVLDFGLAKALDAGSTVSSGAGGPSPLSMSPTITTPAMTQLGLILGTAAYMSPEQAKGRAADKRSDIWAFGAVLYEMLSGQRAFKGDDVSDTLASVLRQDVDWTSLPDMTPAALKRLVARCLDREPKRRLRDIGEARIVLDDPATLDTTAERSSAAPTPSAQPLWRRAVPIALTATVTAVIAATAAWMLKRSTPIQLPVVRFPLALPEGQSFSGTGRHMLAVSPDGTQVVYVALQRLYRRALSEVETKAIPGLDGQQNVTSPVFSPDGQSIVFFAGGENVLKKIAVTGGAATTLCAADNPYGISWDGDTVVYAQGGKGIMRVSADGGPPEVLVSAQDGSILQGPQLLPGGQTLLFTLARTADGIELWDRANVIARSLTSGEQHILIQGSDARYVPTGHLVYALRGTVFGVPFDVRRLAVTGGPVPLVEGVRRASTGVGASPGAVAFGGLTGAANFSVSRTGSLVYIPGPVSASTDRVDVVLSDGASVTRLKLPSRPFTVPRVSPDGRRIAIGTEDGKEATVWIYELSGATTMRPLTFSGRNRFPIWTRDGKRVVFQSDREGDLGLFWTAADGSTGAGERLTKADGKTSHVPESWSPTADHLIYSVVTGRDEALWTLSMSNRKATPFDTVHSTTPIGAVFSPDGRWFAYTSTEPGRRTTIYVQPFPPTGPMYQLFTKEADQPHHPVWSPDGRTLFYIPRPGGFESVSVTTQPTFTFGNPVAAPRPFGGASPSVRRLYDITPDGKFVGLVPAGQSDSGTTAPTIQVVVNWTEELKARIPTK